VPYFRYYEKYIAQLYYLLWIIKDAPSFIILNFLYHGETILPNNLKYCYVLHSPASLIPHRYNFISNKIQQFKNIIGVAVSDIIKKEAVPYFNNKLLKIIYHGVNLNKFNINAQYLIKTKLNIVTISALEEWKGIQDIIKAISSPDLREKYKFDIYGEGPYENELILLINQHDLGDIVTFKGSINNIEKVLPKYDIYCQMSNGEAFGLSLFEALACGLPSIVYDYPPFDSLLPNQISFKIKNKSIKHLEKALLEYKDCKLREKYGKAGKKYVSENFSTKSMALQYFQLLKG